MPKLQHIRVAGKFFVDFDIPRHMENLWRYISEMYQLDAFTQSCPADQVVIWISHLKNAASFGDETFYFQDIIHMYKMQQQRSVFDRTKSHEELETPTFTTTVPIK